MASEREKAIAALRGRGVSRLAEADARDLVEFFLAELDRTARDIEAASRAGDAATVRDLAQQLADAASGYGFPKVTDLARALEHAVLEDEDDLSIAAEKVESLLLVCRRIAADC